MASVFQKLNLKHQTEIVVLNAPASFEAEIATLSGVEVVRAIGTLPEVAFVVAFVTKQKELDGVAKALAKKAKGDAVLWFAYPKASSKTLTCEFNRDSGWDVIRGAGFDSVRAVAIDADWSALRFRRVEFIGK